MTTPEQDALARATHAGDLAGVQGGARPAAEALWQALAQVPDPEIPVVSVVELGIVRDLAWHGERLRVSVTPTYSGCPATDVIRDGIREALLAAGVPAVDVVTVLSPAWTTDWIAPEARSKLRAYGIAPPGCAAPRGDVRVDVSGISPLRRATAPVPCPRCGSAATSLLAQFGSTACKALYRCDACREPFDYFKPH